MSVPSSESGPPTPLSRKQVCPPPPGTKRGGHTRLYAGEVMVRGPNSDDWRKSLVLCMYSGSFNSNKFTISN